MPALTATRPDPTPLVLRPSRRVTPPPTKPANLDASLSVAAARRNWHHIWLAPVSRPRPPAPRPIERQNPGTIDLRSNPPDIRLIDAFGPANCLRHGLVPWRSVGGATVIAAARADALQRALPQLTACFGRVLMAHATQQDVEHAVLVRRAKPLIKQAETRTPPAASCRSLATAPITAIVAGIAALLLASLVFAPMATATALFLWTLIALAAMTVLRLAATVSEASARLRLSRRFSTSRAPLAPEQLPPISLLVPLLRETDISAQLTQRLSALDYPADRLDIHIVLEQDDGDTHHALRGHDLAPNMHIVRVPRGTIRTKPRALNYALNFAQSDIIGIYDAEDAPDPDQLLKVAAAFHTAPADVACLQGRLDFYNTRRNWLTRCFTIDYAAWFRVMLPGLSRLGFAIPLGGTTLFLRRAALEAIGGWDAHNVTEDADLGIRLARNGFQTRLIDTTTREEATTRIRPWIRQRSRWLKGYALTYAVHMRNPRALLRDLGLRRFLGFQALFLGTLTLFVAAPLLWTFWALPFGLTPPVLGGTGRTLLIAVIALFLISEVVSLGTQLLAVSTPAHRWLWLWIPTMHLYHPLAVLAAYKGLNQILMRPFYWDKTDHGTAPSERD
ncbi:MAG: glycosyltransferase family 2 protein [Pseudomonadota bacterium]